MRYDIAIVGGGLAGACAALWLSRDRSVVVLEADEPASGATGVAAGLVNPFKGIRATQMWRHQEALDALQATLQAAGSAHLFRPTGVFRPALDERQVGFFRKAVKKHGEELLWLDADAAGDRHPNVAAPLGGLWVPSGGVVALADFTTAMLGRATKNAGEFRPRTSLTGWVEAADGVRLSTTKGDLEANTLLLCLGSGFSSFPNVAALPLHKVKGQAIWLERPSDLADDLPPISASLYVVPDRDQIIVGSTFEHAFDHLAPDPETGLDLRRQAAKLVPALADARIVDARAGVRVTVPKIRLPLLGPLPASKRVWIFSGLGAKGLVTAPLLAKDLPTFLAHPETLPLEVRPPG